MNKKHIQRFLLFLTHFIAGIPSTSLLNYVLSCHELYTVSIHDGLKRRKFFYILLFVDPSLLSAGPGGNLVLAWEPEGNLLFGTVDGVRTVAHVAANVNGIIEADGAWSRGKWVGGTEDEAASLDDLAALPDHGDNWARGHVTDETWEEGLVLQVLIVLLEVLLGGRDHFDGDELEATLLEAGNNVTDKSTLDTVWLDSNEGLLRSHFDPI